MNRSAAVEIVGDKSLQGEEGIKSLIAALEKLQARNLEEEDERTSKLNVQDEDFQKYKKDAANGTNGETGTGANGYEKAEKEKATTLDNERAERKRENEIEIESKEEGASEHGEKGKEATTTMEHDEPEREIRKEKINEYIKAERNAEQTMTKIEDGAKREIETAIGAKEIVNGSSKEKFRTEKEKERVSKGAIRKTTTTTAGTNSIKTVSFTG